MFKRRQDMKSRGILVIFLYATCVQLSVFAAIDSDRFESCPSIVTLPIGARITFEVAKPTDIEISVLDTSDRVVRHLSAGEPWRAAEQPELRKALELAPLLPTESLGEPARGVNVWERWMVPNHDGKTWDVLQIYFKEYYGPTWLYAV
ncbi:MAG: hypothetical protein JSV16_08095, partial [Candidatus Hydrogenedentota bacterium]